MKIKSSNSNDASWKPVTVKSNIPGELSKLEELAHNMWWAWNHSARSLFTNLDPELYEECGQNPVMLLERLSFERLEELSKDKTIIKKIGVYLGDQQTAAVVRGKISKKKLVREA